MLIRIGTRGSDLALWQAHHVQGLLQRLDAAEVQIHIIKTEGDRIQDVPLTPDLGKSFFTKEIEDALLRSEIDLAVHSLKDLAVESPPGLMLACIPPRERPTERLLIHPDGHDIGGRWLPLRKGAIVGTSSPRRQRRLRELRPDLEIRELRGNVPTRVGKCQQGDYDAILIAYAGLARLAIDLVPLHAIEMPLDLICGAPGQGALGLQIREGDDELRDLLLQLQDPATARATGLERRLLKRLGGGCSLPFGAHATCGATGPVRLRAYLFSPEGTGGSLQFDSKGSSDEALLERATAALMPAITRPLAGRTMIVVEGPQKAQLTEQLETAGAEVHVVKAFEYENRPTTREEIEFLAAADHVLIASKYAAARLEQELARHETTLRDDATLLVTGQATRRFTRSLFSGYDVLLGDPPRSAGMGKVAVARGARDIASVGAVSGAEEGAEYARQHGCRVQAIHLYDTKPAAGIQQRWAQRLGETPEAVVFYLSPAAVRSAPPVPGRQGLRWLAIGPATAASLEGHGLTDYATTQRPDLSGVLAVLAAQESS